jgi:hypothetical protein
MALNPDYFWTLTYAEFVDMYKGHHKRFRRKINEIITAAWRTEAFRRTEKLEDLTNYLIGDDTPKKPEAMSDMQMFNMIKAFNAALGGKEVVTDG